MSFQAMDWASKQETGKSGSKFVLLMLANYANNESGLCSLSLKTIASVCEMTKVTVVNHLKNLQDKGIIEIIHRSQDGVCLSNHYRLLMDKKNGDSIKTKPGVVKKLNQGSIKIKPGGGIEIKHKPVISFNQSINQPPQPPKGGDSGFEEMKQRIGKLFSRRPSTEWSEKEISKLRKILKRQDADNELLEIEALYNSPWPYKRKALETFLNNWTSELDRARDPKNHYAPPEKNTSQYQTQQGNGIDG